MRTLVRDGRRSRAALAADFGKGPFCLCRVRRPSLPGSSINEVIAAHETTPPRHRGTSGLSGQSASLLAARLRVQLSIRGARHSEYRRPSPPRNARAIWCPCRLVALPAPREPAHQPLATRRTATFRHPHCRRHGLGRLPSRGNSRRGRRCLALGRHRRVSRQLVGCLGDLRGHRLGVRVVRCGPLSTTCGSTQAFGTEERQGRLTDTPLPPMTAGRETDGTWRIVGYLVRALVE